MEFSQLITQRFSVRSFRSEHTISDLERLADHAVAIAKAGQEISEKGIDFSPAAK